ncbi:MAG: phosphoglucosamine mutase [archaeon]|nr:phosphoglucosamine mutase [archaeon]
MTKMFGTNGVRGIVNSTLDVELALQLGKAIGIECKNEYLKAYDDTEAARKENPDGKIPFYKFANPSIDLDRNVNAVAIAVDTRISADMLRFAVSSGLMAVGCDVLYLGALPTPALQLYVKNHAVIGGVMITASHNPPEYNGIKVISFDGTEASEKLEAAIEDRYDDTNIELAGWDTVGESKTVLGADEAYVDSIVSKVNVAKIKAAKLRVVLDCTNGAAFHTSPLLLKKLGVSAVTLNADPQGEFPGHQSEPTEDNLSDLKEMVKITGAALGIAHDGDADRCVFVDDKGNYVSGDKALAILGGSIVKAHKGGIVVTPVATSSLIDEVITDAGGQVIRTAVGSPKVAREMMVHDDGWFGGEENGGLIFFDQQYCRDGGMAIGRMLESILNEGPLSDQVARLPIYYTVKKKVKCPDNLKVPVVKFLDEQTADLKKDKTDGLKLLFENGWVHARASGTEAIFRVYAESKDKDLAEKWAEHYRQIVEKFIEDNLQ